ncbi:MAG: YccF domain-containing protein [Elusimicrobiales bacterium]|nr:YccF domain-containing protein [Elusimicrobiales bacterium]
MSVILNILWFVFTGLWAWIAWAVCGVLCYITIIGIPFGIQCFKIAQLSAWPFGTDVQIDFMAHPIANVLWAIFFGWEFALAHASAGLFWCITILGIPWGIQCFKLAILSLVPFGAKLK